MTKEMRSVASLSTSANCAKWLDAFLGELLANGQMGFADAMMDGRRLEMLMELAARRKRTMPASGVERG